MQCDTDTKDSYLHDQNCKSKADDNYDYDNNFAWKLRRDNCDRNSHMKISMAQMKMSNGHVVKVHVNLDDHKNVTVTVNVNVNVTVNVTVTVNVNANP